MKARETAAPRVFRVESVQPYGWIVYLEGFVETYHFMSRSLAMMYARESARKSTRRVLSRSWAWMGASSLNEPTAGSAPGVPSAPGYAGRRRATRSR